MYKVGRRSWIKLWVNEHLRGTTRFLLTIEERAVWVDLLALAGDSRFPGIIASGEEQEEYLGYPLSWICGVLNISLKLLQKCLEIFKEKEQINYTVKQNDGINYYVITITNWNRYQSEYQRLKIYLDKKQSEAQNRDKELTPEEVNENKEIIANEMKKLSISDPSPRKSQDGKVKKGIEERKKELRDKGYRI